MKERIMKNTFKVFGLAIIAVIGLAALLLTGCDNDEGEGERETEEKTPVFTSISDLGTYLSGKPANTTATAYKAALNVNDITNLKITLNDAKDKYVYLDLSGSTVTEIPNYAFNTGSGSYIGCFTLTGITIPNSVTRIGIRAFLACINLTGVTIPNSVTVIEERAFSNSGLTGVTIPNSVISIGERAFSSSRLTSVTIPNGVISIGDKAFSNSLLKSVTIPNSVTSIGKAAFDCTFLTTINLADGNSVYVIENGVLYNKNKTVLHTYPAGKTDVSFIIPNGVTSIWEGAFYNCRNLTSLTIPASVTSIEAQIFSYYCRLTSVTFQGTISLSEFDERAFVLGNLRDKFYETDIKNGTPGRYTTTYPEDYDDDNPFSYTPMWIKQP